MTKHFTELTTNVKGPSRQTMLGPCVAIVGNSRQGKSAELDAIRLAITGRHPIGPHPSDLMQLATQNSEMLYAKISGPLGSASTTISRDTKGKARTPEFSRSGVLATLSSDDREKLLPTLSLRDLLDLGAVRSREALFARFGGGASVPEPFGLDQEGRALWSRAAESCASGTDGSMALAEMAAWLRREKLAIGRDVKGMKERATELHARLATLSAGVETLPKLETQYEQALATSRLQASKDRLELERTRLKQADEQIARFKQEIETASPTATAKVDTLLHDRVASLAGQIKESSHRLARAVAVGEVIDALLGAGVTECPVCGQHKATEADLRHRRKAIDDLVRERTTDVARLEAQHDELVHEIQRQEDVVENENLKRKDERNLRERRLQELVTLKASSASIIKTLEESVGDAASYSGPPVAELRAEIDRLRSVQPLRKQLEELELELRRKRISAEVAKDLETKAYQLLKTTAAEVAHSAETAVNRYMPSGFTAKLETEDDCRWTVIGTDGMPHPKGAMCGSEKAALMIALALAWTDGAPIRIAVLDDEDLGPFHSTPANQRALLARLQESVESGALTQVFVAGLRKDEVPNGWTIIER